MTLVVFVVGLGLLVGGAEALVRGAVRVARTLGVSPLVIGLTVVAYGTSAPEMAVSVKAALADQTDLSLGNVVGSNIFNVLFILGVSAAITPLLVNRRLLRSDLWVMLTVSGLTYLLGLDGHIGRVDGLLLLGMMVAYTAWSIRQSRRENQAVQSEFAKGFGVARGVQPAALVVSLGLVVLGLALLVVGARWLLQGAVGIAAALGVGERVIGLTIVAAGTSLPEVATSIVAAVRGERDIAVGNVVGSNIFNILAVLGAAAAIGPSSVNVSNAALRFDIPVMILAAAACLPIFYTARRIDRWEGWLFLAGYALYTSYLVYTAAETAA
ncbi:MAG TPA: calcium/sodium antiporter [Phycisphaerae bacterium]|nr:calcium/sodium antiporter [Phycisphaerae bacterium]